MIVWVFPILVFTAFVVALPAERKKKIWTLAIGLPILILTLDIYALYFVCAAFGDCL